MPNIVSCNGKLYTKYFIVFKIRASVTPKLRKLSKAKSIQLIKLLLLIVTCITNISELFVTFEQALQTGILL